MTKNEEYGKIDELAQQARRKNHLREQRVRDAINRVSVLSIYLVFGFIIGSFFIFLHHYWAMDDWTTLQSWFFTIVAAFSGYVFRHWQDNGMEREE